MRTKFNIPCLFLILFVCFCHFVYVSAAKFKRKVDYLSEVNNNIYTNKVRNDSESRGFLPLGGILSLGKVLNFFPVGGERECTPAGFNIARAGICLNPYDCRQRDGKATGDCAHGLGVCCIFEVTCGGVVQNNITYFVSPGFPDLWTGDANCTLQIEAAHAGITQLRIDFVHFTLGQPNRYTGECDEDTMVLGEGANNITLCGQNHGQHLYYTLSGRSETREVGELPRARSTPLVITMRGGEMARLWLIRINQMPLAYSAPHNCLQYYVQSNGTIRTFNYASNGRYLAGQEYKACIRRDKGSCSIRYTPCDRRSFRIGTRRGDPMDDYVSDDMEQMPSDDVDNTEEGSGQEPQIADDATQQNPMSRIWSFILPRWLWEGRTWRWSPYAQHYDVGRPQLYGYGAYGPYAASGYGRQRCADRVTIPCENEYFVSREEPGVCDPHHCGTSFCPGKRFEDCSVQTSIVPFAVSVYFGPPAERLNPDENIGMCLQYRQISCDE